MEPNLLKRMAFHLRRVCSLLLVGRNVVSLLVNVSIRALVVGSGSIFCRDQKSRALAEAGDILPR